MRRSIKSLCLLAEPRSLPTVLGLRISSIAVGLSVSLGALISATADELPMLSIKEAQAELSRSNIHQPFRTAGVVVFFNVERTSLSIQDFSGGMWIGLRGNALLPQVKLGQHVEVSGNILMGAFAPDFSATTLRITGEPGWPEPIPVTGSELLSGAYDCRFVEVTGIVRTVLPWGPEDQKSAIIHLDTKGVRVRIITPTAGLGN